MILSVARDGRAWYAAAVAILMAATIMNGRAFLRALGKHKEESVDYSYVEFDFPPSVIPLSQHPYDSHLTIEDSVHYAPNASAEWASLFPTGSGGFVRLSQNHRLFGVSMFHQLHCLDKMRRAVLRTPPNEWERWHTQHCLNYVRQMLLCASSVRLEPVKTSAQPGMEKVDGIGLEHTCRDWSVLRRIAEENFKGWPDDVYP